MTNIPERMTPEAALDVLREDAKAAMTLRGVITGEGTEIIAKQRSDEAIATLAALAQRVESLTAELQHAHAAVESKAGWEWRQRANAAEAKADALQKDAVPSELTPAQLAAIYERAETIHGGGWENLYREVYRVAVEAARTDGGWLAALEKDAGRYAWLKANVCSGSMGIGGGDWISADEAEDWDAAIDRLAEGVEAKPQADELLMISVDLLWRACSHVPFKERQWHAEHADFMQRLRNERSYTAHAPTPSEADDHG